MSLVPVGAGKSIRNAAAPDTEMDTAVQKLEEILEEAVTGEAGSITLEYVDEGLEICHMFGGRGIGNVVRDPKLKQEIIDLIVDKAELQGKSTRVMPWVIRGRRYDVAVEEYDSFGESAFKLILGKPKR